MSVTQAAFKDGQKWDLNEEESDFEEYYDACSDHYDFDSYKTDFKTSIEHAELALQYFFNNQFDEARNILQPFAETSFYHSLGYAVFSFLEAMLTFENVEGASAKIKKCIELCQLFRKKNTLTESITSTFKKKNYSQLTDQECHAELCLAEALLMNALLTFIEDDNLSGLIRGSLKVRQCYSGFRACEQIMKSREWIFDVVKDSASVSTHFASGVYMGIGTFNLMISILPGRILNILKFIGFTGSKTINKELVLLKDPSQTSQLYYADNRALCLLLRGAFYRQMEQPNLALQDLHDCLTQRGIKEDLFLLPYAYVESALCYVPFNKNQAISMLQDTKKKFSHYALESRLHLRIHMALMDLNDNTDGEL
ncbi:tetratricopeptide repeat protein 39B-like isoform X3 [Drosophila miranda]|uniref:tetratricopeptide repeat protein 39B-like isoform X3 n=1 Tax=Drosophila miranda TaxID=7229 RepID=UPI0007E78E12|nr:tetratricopeptide repeat protein 39B-like isoform X3 [Drosophila miranda]